MEASMIEQKRSVLLRLELEFGMTDDAACTVRVQARRKVGKGGRETDGLWVW